MIYGKRVYGKWHKTLVRFTLLLIVVFFTMFGFVSTIRFRRRLLCPPCCNLFASICG